MKSTLSNVDTAMLALRPYRWGGWGRRSASDGYATVLMVITLGLVCMGLLMAVYKATLRTQDTQRGAQLRVDIAQRENAILRSLLAIAPNRAIEVMRANSMNTSTVTAQWSGIFADALVLANASDSDGAENTANGLGGNNVRVGNAANFTTTVADVFRAPGASTAVILAGINNPADAPSPPYPPSLTTLSAAAATADAAYPIVSSDKVYGSTSTFGAQLSVTEYPRINRIPYPNIRFGYGQPGGTFLAKRNWWAFSIRFPSNVPGVPALRKHYVLSLYEVPSQVALSSSAFMSLGQHSDGSAWTGVQIQGSIYGDRILAEGATSANRMSSRTGIEIGTAPTVNGTIVGANFDSDSTTAVHEAANGTFYPVSIAAGAGRVAFVPLNRGLDFYTFVGSSDDVNRISPTSWNDYSIGARQCAIKVTVTKVASTTDQTPQSISVNFRAGSTTSTVVLDRADGSWPVDTLIPFQTETTQTGRKALTIHINRLDTWLATVGGSGIAVNHSLAINPDIPSLANNVRAPSFPSDAGDLAVVIRDGNDLTAFTSGLSIVTNLRLFFADDLNQVSTAAPAGSGLTGTFFPPLSVFSPEKRWGVTVQEQFVRLDGQVGTIGASNAVTMNRPLDMRTGADAAGGADPLASSLNITLSEKTSPAELPPVSFPNWMFTIEEVDPRSAGLTAN